MARLISCIGLLKLLWLVKPVRLVRFFEKCDVGEFCKFDQVCGVGGFT